MDGENATKTIVWTRSFSCVFDENGAFRKRIHVDGPNRLSFSAASQIKTERSPHNIDLIEVDSIDSLYLHGPVLMLFHEGDARV